MMKNEQVAVVSGLVRWRSGPDVLLGVRRAAASSGRHPGVLSTITMRVPSIVMGGALAEAGLPAIVERGSFVRAAESCTSVNIGAALSLANIGGFLMESLLARKLAAGDLLVAGSMKGYVRPLGVSRAVVSDPKGGGEEEDTLMLTYEVDLREGKDLLASQTQSYSRFHWASSAKIADALEANDPLLLVPDEDPFEVCIHGLCVRAAADLGGL